MSDADDYKRQIDLWIKIAVVATPLLSAAVSWGVIKATVNNQQTEAVKNYAIMDRRITVIEQYISNQAQAAVELAKVSGQASEQAHEMNRRLERIEVLLDSRLRR